MHVVYSALAVNVLSSLIESDCTFVFHPDKAPERELKNRIIRAMHEKSYSYSCNHEQLCKNGWDCRQARHEEAHSYSYATTSNAAWRQSQPFFIDVTGD